MPELTVPGKVFLMGEYGVLQGSKGICAALKPGYTFQWGEGTSPSPWIHPDSPLGVYQMDTGHSIFIEQLKVDADLAMGQGFGSSTAELIAGVYADLERLPETKRVWAWYREFFPRASGADLIAQMEALRTGFALFEVEDGGASSFSASSLLSEIQVLQINSDLKLKTHEALKQDIPTLDVNRMNQLVARVKNGLEQGDRLDLQAFNEFAEILNQAGLETKLAHETRLAFSKTTGVYAVKGCGAGLHDVFLVASELKTPCYFEKINALAERFQFTPLGSLQELLW